MKLSRKQFILSHGATCKNWYWSWSFVNENKKNVIFGVWDVYANKKESLILSNDWEYKLTRKGKMRKQNGFSQSIEHIGLIKKEGYKLFTFTIYRSNPKNEEPGAPAKILRFDHYLAKKELEKKGDGWYAYDFTED